ncbi:MAG TPA: isoamylase early set domain-containing protein [Candidatus Paceibacterota bacterium]|nr:isoamylase early set domain-containing protein [Verrucomicrobiota bacterium]HSA10804.1 isoamylase early set domain-containing protein [Candidatus Paceibacterota bacterium]
MQPRHNRATTAARPAALIGTHPEQLSAERPVEFTLKLPRARSVAVAGTFNDWGVDRTPMSAGPGGTWKATVWLPAGRYEYRFVADGEWLNDPTAKECIENTFGSTNSVLVV